MAGSSCVHFTECDTAGIFNPNFVTTDMFDVRSEHSQYDDYYYDLYVFLSGILSGIIFFPDRFGEDSSSHSCPGENEICCKSRPGMRR